MGGILESLGTGIDVSLHCIGMACEESISSSVVGT